MLHHIHHYNANRVSSFIPRASYRYRYRTVATDTMAKKGSGKKKTKTRAKTKSTDQKHQEPEEAETLDNGEGSSTNNTMASPQDKCKGWQIRPQIETPDNSEGAPTGDMVADTKGKGKEHQDNSHATTLDNGEEPSTSDNKYEVPPITRPHLKLQDRYTWPKRDDGTSVRIEEMEEIIHQLTLYSRKQEGNPAWDALKPTYWIPMLDSIRNHASNVSLTERTAMQRDLEYYRSKFPSTDADVLRWPMTSNGHLDRFRFGKVLVN
jgi:hypothetical protein